MGIEPDNPDPLAFITLLGEYPGLILNNHLKPPNSLTLEYYNSKVPFQNEKPLGKLIGERNLRIVITPDTEGTNQQRVLVRESKGKYTSGYKFLGLNYYAYLLGLSDRELTPLDRTVVQGWSLTTDYSDRFFLEFQAAKRKERDFLTPTPEIAAPHLELIRVGLSVVQRCLEYSRGKTLLPDKRVTNRGESHLLITEEFKHSLWERAKLSFDSDRQLLPWFKGVKDFAEFAEKLHLANQGVAE